MKGRIDESIFLDYEGPGLQHCDGGRGRGNSPKLGHGCVAGITLRTATDRTLWWNCTRRAGLAERRCERYVPVRVWLEDIMKDIVEDVLQRGVGVKDVAYIKEMSINPNNCEI